MFKKQGKSKLLWGTMDDKSYSTKSDIPDDVDDDTITQQKKIRYKQDTHYRCIFSWWVISVVSIWLSAVLFFLYLQGTKQITLTETTIVTLLATTTANILGLAYIVLKGMFQIPFKENFTDR